MKKYLGETIFIEIELTVSFPCRLFSELGLNPYQLFC